MNAYVPPPKKISKATLSMYLRTRCDKELFLSLHEEHDLAALGMPIPITRAGIGRLSRAGADFERERNEQLVRLLGTAVRYKQGAKGVFSEIDLNTTLTPALPTPTLILQPQFSIDSHRLHILSKLGLSATDASLIPELAHCRPDILIVRAARAGDTEVQLTAGREPIDSTTETRQALVLLDVKHTAEANASYCAEVAFYVAMLAHWLSARPALAKRYFVAGNAYIWSRSKIGRSTVEALEAAGGGSSTQVLQALEADAEDAYLGLHLPVVRQFFENVARVVAIADVSNTAWDRLSWHVMGSCSGCDWLGDKRHIDRKDHPTVDAHPEHYCYPRARADSHLSLVPGITRGARRTLQQHAIVDAGMLSTSAGHPALQQHSILKREAKNLPVLSNAILTGALASDADIRIASLDDYPQLKLYAAINFDPSSGLLTGLSLSGSVSTYTRGVAPRRFTAVPFIVDQKTSAEEWTALYGLLNYIAQCLDQAEAFVGQAPTGQIHFWDKRQFQELCHALGRHLPQVLNLVNRRERALAWLFPPDDLMTHPDALDASSVTYIADLIRRSIFTPTPHAVTLFGTAEHYAAGPVAVERDPYYREYLTDGIPRERIYEIWANDSIIRRGASTGIPRNTAIARYAQTLTSQVRALESVTERLRTDYRGQFRAKSPRIPSSIPRGTQSVAFDGKLWVWWDRLNFQATQLEAHIRLGLDGERLEASYEAILLSNGRAIGLGLYEFDVPPGSREAKLTEDSILALGKLGRPGLPLERAAALLPSSAPRYPGSQDLLLMPLWSVLKVELELFDRVQGTARVHLTHWQDPQFVPYLLRHSRENLLDRVFLVDSKRPEAFNWASRSATLLQAIGIPPIERPDPNAAAAMGITPPRRRGTDPVTPVARVLWDAGTLAATRRLPPAAAAAFAAFAQPFWHLNPSQSAAVEHATGHALTAIWGPPGTGKTNTLAALVHALIRDAVARNAALRILITGPTYKAVQELINRTIDGVTADPAAPCHVWMGYSVGRFEAPPAGLSSHIQYTSFTFTSQDSNYTACIQTLVNSARGVCVMGAQVLQTRRFAEEIHGSAVGPVFDVIILDESSQITVSQSLAPLAGMTDNGRVIIAGDYLQMPPITSLDPPEQADYLVGSIQTYLLKRPFLPRVQQCPLDDNYRSADQIVNYLHRIGYRQSLRAVFPATRLHFVTAAKTNGYPPGLPACPQIADILNPDRAVVTFLHDDEVSSQGNLVEAQFVAGLVWVLRHSVSAELAGRGAVLHRAPTPKEFWERCIGVVTPHRAQRALVVVELQRLFPGEEAMIQEAVDTVEKFQGGQRHTIIVTFGVADVEVIVGEEAFLMQRERMNVAVSRAQGKCIVIMPHSLATHIPEDRRALATAHAVKEYVEVYCDTRLNTTLLVNGQPRTSQIRFKS